MACSVFCVLSGIPIFIPLACVHVGCLQVLNSKMLEQETRYRQLSQEQLDNFTLDMNSAYARLKGMEEAIDSKITQRLHLVISNMDWDHVLWSATKRCYISRVTQTSHLSPDFFRSCLIKLQQRIVCMLHDSH